MEIYLKAWKYGLKATYYAFMPAKIKTEGKYVHEDLKEPQSSQLEDKEQDNSATVSKAPNSPEKGLEQTKTTKSHLERGTLAGANLPKSTVSKPTTENNGKKEKSDTPEILSLDEVMKRQGYCEDCGN
jgi:hypothetical protein